MVLVTCQQQKGSLLKLVNYVIYSKPIRMKRSVRFSFLKIKVLVHSILDARLMTTFFHRGHRFFHKKLSSPTFDGTSATNNSLHEINEIITQNIPQNDIQSIYVHFELIIHQLHTNKQSIISCGTFLFGEFTRYESVWQRMLIKV